MGALEVEVLAYVQLTPDVAGGVERAGDELVEVGAPVVVPEAEVGCQRQIARIPDTELEGLRGLTRCRDDLRAHARDAVPCGRDDDADAHTLVREAAVRSRKGCG